MAKITATVKVRQPKPDGAFTQNPKRAEKRQSGPQYKTCGTCGGTGRVKAK